MEKLLNKSNNIADLRNFLVRLEKGYFTRIVESRIAELKNIGLYQDRHNEALMSPADVNFAKAAAAARKELLPVPLCVQRILKGDYTYISSDHKRLIRDCGPWTIAALKHAYLDPEIKRQVRLLLGTFQYTQCLSWAQPSWPQLMAGLRKEMLSIGSELQEIYISNNLAEILGALDPPLLHNTNFRQDCEGGMCTASVVVPLPSFCSASRRKYQNHVKGHCSAPI